MAAGKKRGLYSSYLKKDDPLESMPRSTRQRLRTLEPSYTAYVSACPISSSQTSLSGTDATLDDFHCLTNFHDKSVDSEEAVVSGHQGDDKMQEEEFQVNEVEEDEHVAESCETVDVLPNETEELEIISISNHSNTDSNCGMPDLNSPLYANGTITLHATLLLILAFALSHKLTQEALTDLLLLINEIIIKPHCLPLSSYLFYKYLNIKLPAVTRHYYCQSCEQPLNTKLSKTCPNDLCKQVNLDTPYFLELSLEDQLKTLFERPSFYEHLQYRFYRRKVNKANIEDIYDGKVYKKHFDYGGILSHAENISLLYNTDGVQVFKSSNYSIWPLYFIINGLPYKLRTCKQNCLLGGLWFGNKKPNMHLFFHSMRKVLLKLESTGLEVQAKVNGLYKAIICKVILLAGTCDMPAKCLVLNFKQFNGFYGCPKCLQPGATLTLGQRSHTHVYPYNTSNPSGPLRSCNQTNADIEHYMNTGNIRNGVLGPTWLGSLQHYDLIRGTAIDYMHCCLLGVVKRLLNWWLEPKNHDQSYYIGNLASIFNSRLLSIKPIAEISRAPRSITDRKHWKASEFRSFLLYYSVPILQGVLPNKYYMHYLLLVSSLRKLLGTSIEPKDIEVSSRFLSILCKHYNDLYGDKEMTVNIHSLNHLTQTVEDLGPLWVYSCFFFESLNGILLQHVHGTQGLGLQFTSNFSYIQTFPTLTHHIDHGPLFLNRIIKPPTQKGPCGVGKSKAISLTDGELEECGGVDSIIQCYSRIMIDGTLYCIKSWHEDSRRQNCTVMFNYDNKHLFGHIMKIVDIGNSFKLFVETVKCEEVGDVSLSGLYKVTNSDVVRIKQARHIIEKCILMHVEGTDYVSTISDSFERD